MCNLKRGNYKVVNTENTDFLFLGSKIRKQLLLGRQVMTNLDSMLKSRASTLPTKVYVVKAMVFPVITHGCENWTIRKSRTPKNWCLWTVVLEKNPESHLGIKIKPVSLKGDWPWMLAGRTDAEAVVFWPSDVNRWLIGKVPDAGRDQEQKEKKTSEDETAGWHHWCHEHDLGQTLGDGEGQGGLACCSPWGSKGSGWETEQQQENTEKLHKANIVQTLIQWEVKTINEVK